MFNIVLRTSILYVAIVLSLRLMGKKQLGELQPSELVTTIIISNIATLSLEEPNIPLLAGIVPIIAIVCLDVFASAFMLKSVRVRKFITGSPRIIVSGGKINQTEMRNLRYTIDDLLEAMRDSGIFALEEVQYAVVETTGKISFLQKTEDASPPPASPNLDDPAEVVIKDGVLNKAGIALTGFDEEKIRSALNERKISAKEVFLMTADRKGGYNLIEREKR